MADYRLHPITWKSITTDYDYLMSAYVNILKNKYKKVRKHVGIGWIG
jgi:hypothetical protein